MAQYAIVTDLNRCVGCLGCSVACKVVNDVPIGSYWLKVLRIGPNPKEDGSGQFPDTELYFLPIGCQHCADPECVHVCPTGASQKLEDGTVQIDKEKCIGCQFCVMACPYNVRYLNEEQRVVEKCTLCNQLTAEGTLPQCVSQCGGRARFFGDLDGGIENMVAPQGGIGVTDTVTLAELGKPYEPSDIHYLPDVGNKPSFAYILRDRAWRG